MGNGGQQNLFLFSQGPYCAFMCKKRVLTTVLLNLDRSCCNLVGNVLAY